MVFKKVCFLQKFEGNNKKLLAKFQGCRKNRKRTAILSGEEDI